MKKDKILFDLENDYEVYMIKEVLTDQRIPFRIAYADDSYFGIVLGPGAAKLFPPFAVLYGYEEDREKIGHLLEEIRTAKPLEDIEELTRPKMWRIKKS